MLEVGTKAPDFTLQNQEGKEVSLSDFKGKKVQRQKARGICDDLRPSLYASFRSRT